MGDVYLDSSFLLKLYVLEQETIIARAHLRQISGSAVISPLSDVEVISALSRRLSVHDAMIAKASYRRNRTAGLFEERPIDNQVFQRAMLLADIESKPHKLKSLDILHLATALQHGVPAIASFDNSLRAAALALGLTVLPA